MGPMKHDVMETGGTADTETGQLLCPIVLCNYKCLFIGLFDSSAFLYVFILYQLE